MIFHFAAESFVSPSWLHPNRYMNVNYNGTLNLLEAIKNFSKKNKNINTWIWRRIWRTFKKRNAYNY